MLWCTASARRTSSNASSRPSGVLMLTAMSRLPRWHPKNGLPAMRIPSPVAGSTLMTSMPRSARIIGPNGPARYWPKSMSVSPSSGPAPFDPSVTSRASAFDADLAPYLLVVFADPGLRAADLAHALLRRQAAHDAHVHELAIRALEDHPLVHTGRVALAHQLVEGGVRLLDVLPDLGRVEERPLQQARRHLLTPARPLPGN